MEKKSLLHVAFIMDGNGRWAKRRNLPRHLGHKEGCERVIDIYEECLAQGIKVMSLYAFSTENWNRPKDEIDHLFDYLEIFFKKYLPRMMKDGCCIRVSGDITPIKEKTKKVILEAVNKTKDNKNFTFNICLNYGSRDEILKAVKELASDVKENKITLDDINKQLFEDHLYTKGLGDIDLMVRTSGEQRLSNFLLYQNAYAEFVFTKVAWPDFKKDAFLDCLEIYNSRSRRFGGLNYEKQK